MVRLHSAALGSPRKSGVSALWSNNQKSRRQRLVRQSVRQSDTGDANLSAGFPADETIKLFSADWVQPPLTEFDQNFRSLRGRRRGPGRNDLLRPGAGYSP